MILIDTSIWIDFFKLGHDTVRELLEDSAVIMHPYVLGEIAIGSLRDRTQRLNELRDLRRLPAASDAEVMAMIEWQRLWGTGLTYVDAHLLAAVRAADPDLGLLLWTRDKALHAEAERFGIAYAP